MFSGKVPMTDSPALKSHNSQIFHNPVTTCPLDTGHWSHLFLDISLVSERDNTIVSKNVPSETFSRQIVVIGQTLGCIVLQSTHRYNLKCCTGVINVISGPYNGSWSEDSEGHFVFRNQLICPQVGHN